MKKREIKYYVNHQERHFNPLIVSQSDRWRIYQELSKCKNYAINKSYRCYYNLPIEKEDLELIAWIAFNEAINKYENQKGKKTFESFLIDAITWRCNDYCERYVTNHHKVLNSASTRNWSEEKIRDMGELFDQKIALDSLFACYLATLKDRDKQLVARALIYDYLEPKNIYQKYLMSKSKVYRLSKEVIKDITRLLI